VTVASAILVPWLAWLALDAVGVRLTAFPIIAFGIATAIGVSLQLEKHVRAAAATVPQGAQRIMIALLGFVGVAVIASGAAFGVQFLFSLADVLERSTDLVPALPAGAILTVLLASVLFRDLRRDTGPSAALIAALSPAPPSEGIPSLEPGSPAEATLRRRTRREPYRGALMETRDLAMHFGGVRALDGVSMEIREGELIGIMGPNGSGKTTMLNCISGFLTPTSGDIIFRGRSMLTVAPHGRAALGLGRTFQNVGLVKGETVYDNLVIAQHLSCGYGVMEGLLRTGAVLQEERRLRARAAAVIDMLGLADIAAERISSLPHGRAKLVEIGAALVAGPELLLLDEPAAGVSPQEADALGGLLKHVASNFGVTILMIEHHVPLMLSTCDYIYVLNFGRLLTHGEPAEVARHPDVIAAYLGTTGKEATIAAAGG
jgi:branched-chain amino acid transport system ATP-binding protein